MTGISMTAKSAVLEPRYIELPGSFSDMSDEGGR